MASTAQHGNQLDVANFSESVDVEFHGTAYILTVSTVANDTLCLAVEQKSDASHWKGEFTARYIEDITAKTGNYKKFPVFVKMLLSAVKQQSDSVFVDLLTYEDLELLKNRKGRGQLQSSKTLPPNNKRYLILTYAAEFDRVHYPLPLQFDDNPDPEYLRGIIKRLRSEVDKLRSNQAKKPLEAEIRRLRVESAELREQLKVHEQRAVTEEALEVHDLLGELQMVKKDRDLLQSRITTYEAELERERGLQRRELRRVNKDLQEAHSEIQKLKEQSRDLRLKCKELTQELETNNRRASQDRIRSTYDPYGRDHSRRPSRSSSVGGGSRTSSRGASPSNSRPPSTVTSVTSGGGRDSRPGSAPARGRFDPTEYVKQKRERERQLATAKGRAPTPPRSVASSGRSTPTSSRPNSAPRSMNGVDRQVANRSQSTKGRNPSNPRSTVAESSESERIERSPGRALHDVRKKLSEYAAQQGSLPEQPSAAGRGPAKLSQAKHDDPSSEIADIDSRLHALQNFLKMAKSAS